MQKGPGNHLRGFPGPSHGSHPVILYTQPRSCGSALISPEQCQKKWYSQRRLQRPLCLPRRGSS